MIKGNVIYFGYGDILVSSKSNGLILTEIKPNQKIGSIPKEKDYEEIQTISVPINPGYTLDSISKTNTSIEFGNYILDFSNYNEESIKVVQRAIDCVIANHYRMLVC